MNVWNWLRGYRARCARCGEWVRRSDAYVDIEAWAGPRTKRVEYYHVTCFCLSFPDDAERMGWTA